MARFRIYYGDGTTFTDGDIGEPPSFGVICILQRRRDSPRYHMVSGTPYYIFVDDEWLPAWQNDVFHRLLILKDTMTNIMEGLLTTKKQFTEVYEQAKADREKECLHNN